MKQETGYQRQENGGRRTENGGRRPEARGRILVSGLLVSRSGYAFLVTVLVIGVMATATATSLMLLGWAAEQNGLLVQQSSQAEAYARSCIERTIRTLRADPSYAGSGVILYARGSCVVRPVVGDGVNDRRVCVEGRSGKSTRRFQVNVAELFPRVKTSSFDEVSAFTLCP